MHRAEADQLVDCLVCGAEISRQGDRPFILPDDRALCFACALARHGVYDEAHDTWTHAPALAGLPLNEQGRTP